MRSGKRLIILTLLGVNLALLVGLVAVNMQPAQARPFKTTDYIMVTGMVGQTTEGVYIIDVASRKMIGLKLDKTSKKMRPMSRQPKNLLTDFKVTN
jgi:hypothetical protein